jgi:ABC-2 type transport system ATP-binding protein
VVDAPDRAALASALQAAGFAARPDADGLVVDADPAEIGRVALAAGVALSALQRRSGGLEDEFLALVGQEETR